MVSQVHPAESVFAEQLAALDNRWTWSTDPALGELRERARSRGLWNLFLPGEHGAGPTNLPYAPLAGITGRSPERPGGSELFGAGHRQYGGVRL